MRGVKETAADSPLTQALSRCYQRIDKDKARGIITAEEQMRLRAKTEKLYHEARTQPGMPYEAFNESLATKNLRCAAQKQARRTPKKAKLTVLREEVTAYDERRTVPAISQRRRGSL